jgi:glucose-1-phosphate cytidylyltransferase
VNGGFFIFEPAIFDYLGGDGDTLEARALTRLATEGELMAYKHDGFWQCMDTAHERDLLENMWREGNAPWANTPARAAMNRQAQRSNRRKTLALVGQA